MFKNNSWINHTGSVLGAPCIRITQQNRVTIVCAVLNRDQQRRMPIKPDNSINRASATASNARRSKLTGCMFERRTDASVSDSDSTSHLKAGSLTSMGVGHLRAGQYYRWNPDISNIAAVGQSCSAHVDSAASRPLPWQHEAFLCSDNDSTTDTSRAVVSPLLLQQVSGIKYTGVS